MLFEIDSANGWMLNQGYDLGKKLVYAATPNRTEASLSTLEITAAGFFSAIPQTFIAAPVERAKVVLQVWVVINLIIFRILYSRGIPAV